MSGEPPRLPSLGRRAEHADPPQETVHVLTSASQPGHRQVPGRSERAAGTPSHSRGRLRTRGERLRRGEEERYTALSAVTHRRHALI